MTDCCPGLRDASRAAAGRPRRAPEGIEKTLTSWVAIDVETANAKRASLCSVGLVSVVDGEVVDSYHSHVRPIETVSEFHPRNVSVHGISEADVIGSPLCVEMLEIIDEFVGDRPLVAHNASFERSVLNQAHDLLGRLSPPRRYFCTMRLARNLWPRLVNHRLPTVASATGYGPLRHHSALDDARASAHIMITGLKARGATGLEVFDSLA